RRNNFLAALVRAAGRPHDRLGAALVDITTADFWVGEAEDAGGLAEAVLLRRPAELLVPGTLPAGDPLLARFRDAGVILTTRDAAEFAPPAAEERLRGHFGVAALEGLGLAGQTAAVRAAGAVLAYLHETQQVAPSHLTRVQRLTLDDHLALDEATVRNLELIESLHDRSARGSLLWALDRTGTAMGGRLLRQWLLRPLREPREIARRLGALEALVEAPAVLEALRAQLGEIGDLARLGSRVALGIATPRDLAGLRAALRPLPALRERAADCPDPLVQETAAGLEDLAALAKSLEAALVDDPPLTAHEGRLIRESYSPALADLRREVREAKTWIAGLETSERERTGIPTLRVRFNRVFGYGIEVSKAHLRLVPAEYIRR